jgi:hypothetical protein
VRQSAAGNQRAATGGRQPAASRSGDRPSGSPETHTVSSAAVTNIGKLRGIRCLALVAVLAAGLCAAEARAATDPREIAAREDFVAGRYQQALDLFAKLYAETLHPVYLRNIGRCYQGLGEPDRAINSFHDYLRKMKGITPDERAEIDGYIKEMEALKGEREAAATGAKPTPAASPPAPVQPLALNAPTPKGDTNVSVVVSTNPAPPPSESTPIYGRWWFWAAVVGVAAAAGVGIAAAAGAFTHTQDATCPMGITCGGP